MPTLRRAAIALTALALLAAAAGRGTLFFVTYMVADRVRLVVRWGESPFAIFGASSLYLVFSFACFAVATIALALATTRFVRGGGGGALRRPYATLRGIYVFHGAVSPFAALASTHHLSPTGRGREALARAFGVILEHESYFALGTAIVAVFFAIAGSQRERDLGMKQAALRGVAELPPVAVALGIFGLALRFLGRAFYQASDGASMAAALEGEALVALVVLVVPFAIATVLVARWIVTLPNGPSTTEEEATKRLTFGFVAKGAAILALPVFALIAGAWSASQPVEPDLADLEKAPVAASDAVQPLPLVTSEEASADVHLWFRAGEKKLQDVWPRGIAEEDVKMVVARDVFDRGKTGIFARFGDGHYGVLRVTLRQREAVPLECASHCVDVRAGAVEAGLSAIASNDAPPRVLYVARPDETTAELARDLGRLASEVLKDAKTNARRFDVDLVAELANPAPTKRKPERAPVKDVAVGKAVRGCTSSWTAATQKPVAIDVAGKSRSFRLTTTGGNATAPRPLLVALHGSQGSGAELARRLDLDREVGDGAVILYLDARAGAWDCDAPEGKNADLAFVDAAVAWAEESMCLDPAQRWVLGYSMGGYLANDLACSGRFRAVAALSAGAPVPFDDAIDPPSGLFRCAHPTAAIIVHGAEDLAIAPAEGKAAVESWRLANRCAPKTTTDGDCTSYVGCEAPVSGCFLPGVGHLVGASAGATVWRFLHQLGAPR